MSGVYEALKDLLDQEKGAALATLVRGDEHVGAKLLVLPGKKSSGSLGNAALDALVLEDAGHAIWSGDASIHTYKLESASGTQSYDVFVEGFPPPPMLIIVGAGHIAIPLTTFAKTLNYRVVVIDARAAFATRERFPHDQVGYVGAIGSRKTSEERSERLKQQGITDEQLQRIHGPIGLNIGAASPEEMALAIMGEIVATRHGKDRTSVSAWKK